MRRIVFSLALAVLVCMPCAHASAQTATTITVGTGHAEAAASVYYALENGFFKRAGLDVSVVVLRNGEAATAGLSSGTLQFAHTNVLTVALAKEHGLALPIVAPGAMYDTNKPTTVLVVAPGSTIRSPKDFEGKVIGGVSLGGISQLGTLEWLQRNNVDVSTIKFVEIPGSGMVAALQQGRIAAAVLTDPYLSAGRAQVRVFAKVMDAVSPHYIETVWISNADWAATHPAIVRSFAAAIVAGGQWASTHPEQAVAILAKDLQVDSLQPHETYAAALDATLLQPILDAAVKNHMLDHHLVADELFFQR